MGAATSIIFIVKTHLLSRQKYACHDKTFVTTKWYLSWQNIFVVINICRDKIMFVVTNICHNRCFATTKVFCHGSFVVTIILLLRQNTSFVMTIFLLRQKWYLGQLLLMILQSTISLSIPPPSHPPSKAVHAVRHLGQQKSLWSTELPPSLSFYWYDQSRDWTVPFLVWLQNNVECLDMYWYTQL